MKTVIFDIDGTISDLDHRLHYIANHPKDYDAFHQACDLDAPIQPIIDMISGCWPIPACQIVLVSGRSDIVREKTEVWLKKHDVIYNQLLMRKHGDWRADTIVKSEILDDLIAQGHNIWFVVDDRSSVVKMWRDRGLTCLQCREWQELPQIKTMGHLTILIGPSGAGKSTYAKTCVPAHVISSDQIRADLCGDFKDQSKNAQVFSALHAIVKSRLENGLPCVVDATNIRRKDRMAVADLAKGQIVEYVVIDRPLPEKLRTAGHQRPEVIIKHDQTFKSQIKDILKGDDLPNVTVRDLRTQ